MQRREGGGGGTAMLHVSLNPPYSGDGGGGACAGFMLRGNFVCRIGCEINHTISRGGGWQNLREGSTHFCLQLSTGVNTQLTHTFPGPMLVQLGMLPCHLLLRLPKLPTEQV